MPPSSRPEGKLNLHTGKGIVKKRKKKEKVKERTERREGKEEKEGKYEEVKIRRKEGKKGREK